MKLFGNWLASYRCLVPRPIGRLDVIGVATLMAEKLLLHIDALRQQEHLNQRRIQQHSKQGLGSMGCFEVNFSETSLLVIVVRWGTDSLNTSDVSHSLTSSGLSSTGGMTSRQLSAISGHGSVAVAAQEALTPTGAIRAFADQKQMAMPNTPQQSRPRMRKNRGGIQSADQKGKCRQGPVRRHR